MEFRELANLRRSLNEILEQQVLTAKTENILPAAVEEGIEEGGATIQGYPASAYVTQLVVRTLLKRQKLPPTPKEKFRRWAVKQTQRQLSLLTANTKTADV